MNLGFLKEQNDYYNLFADACIEAEKHSLSRRRCAPWGAANLIP